MSITDYACADEPAHIFAYHADCLTFLRQLPDDWTHAIITDPPYGLADHKASVVAGAITAWATGDRERVPSPKGGFMGRAWDSFVPPPAVWDECLRVLKPGGHLAVFAGSRTVDLMGLSIRLAGFEVRDGIAAWLYGEGMPKGKAQLKPAHEPILLARKPFRGSMVANIAEHRTGGLAIDACRVGREPGDRTEYGRDRHLPHANTTESMGTFAEVTPYAPHDQGRWPTNVVLAHHPDCGPDEAPGPCVPGCQVAALDEQSGTLTSGVHAPHHKRSAPGGNGETHGAMAGVTGRSHDDSGGASRFFPTFRYQAKAPKVERPIVDGKGHVTVKPLGLCRWLIRLLVPGPDGNGEVGCVLDPFAGSGATLEAARLEGRRAVGIERDEHSARLIAERLGVEFREPSVASESEPTPTEVLFAKVAVAESVDALMELYRQAVADELWCDEVRAMFAARRVELESVAA